MKKIALLFAGQGAQSVGMGRELAAEFPVAAELFEQADLILGRDLSRIAWDGPIEELTKTSNCQPALFVHGLASLAVLRQNASDLEIDVAAGLSLGEWTAHAAAGTFDFTTGLKLVEQRGRFMEEACEATLGTMAAMIGGTEGDVRALAADTDVDIANLNAPGQIVISGEVAKVELAVSLAKERGIRRATLLNVAGAYHSRLMDSAFVKMGEALLEAELQMPRFTVVSNVTGEVVDSLPEIRRTLQDQITSTVLWTDCIAWLVNHGCELFIELGPGAVLTGLVQRIQKDANIICVSDNASLATCVEKLRTD
jgi:[acyl-carrier-protein] S-malonyltransferase